MAKKKKKIYVDERTRENIITNSICTTPISRQAPTSGKP